MSRSSSRRAAAEALAWEAKLRRPSISNQEIAEFRAWLDVEANSGAWDLLTAERYVHARFVVRRDATGFSVVDLDAAPVVTAAVPLVGMSGFDAQAAAQALNRRELDHRHQAGAPRPPQSGEA